MGFLEYVISRRKIFFKLTWLLWVQCTIRGGSGRCLTIHVKLTVDPKSMYNSGPPGIVVIGSVIKYGNEYIIGIIISALKQIIPSYKGRAIYFGVLKWLNAERLGGQIA